MSEAASSSAPNHPDAFNQTKAVPSETPSLANLLRLAKPEWPGLAIACFLMIVAESAPLLNPLLLADAYDTLVDPEAVDRMQDISRTMITVLVVHSVGSFLGFIRQALMSVAGERVVARLRNLLFVSLMKQEMSFFDEHQSGELISRLTSDTAVLQIGTSQALPEVILGMVKLVVCMALMFWISAYLAIVVLGCVVVLFCISIPIGTWLGKLSREYQNVLGTAQGHATEVLGAMRTVQSFAAEKREAHRYEKVVGDPDQFPLWWATHKKDQDKTTTYRVGFFKAIVAAGFFTLIFGVGFGCLYVSLWYGFKLVNDGEITLGELTAFQSYVFYIGAGLGQTSSFVSKLLEAQGASGRIMYLLNRVPAIPIPVEQKNASLDKSQSGRDEEETPAIITVNHYVPTIPLLRPDAMEGNIRFENVNFFYPSRPESAVLVNFSLTIPANSTAALVGASGAGKSTVVALLQRFYDVSSGAICIDGHDLRDLDLSWLRSNIGFVQQEPQLFGLTVRENICYGIDREVSLEELEEVSRKANAHDFIVEWPQQYDTMVGERGVKLSGGQKQRIAIARALLVNPRILLLDEATSALDAESEHLVQEAIDKAVVGRTVVIVAHRLSTIKRAKQIVVVDDHRIIDSGTHDELLQRCTKYQELIQRQSMHSSQ
ncbi:ATP-binding cassette, subfamily B (MDR/TAP), member 10 [Fistulifera solaris]|uniref:ATP-binding cassette, subfamily B (MDR/TAP), member 10 n=1 Tax=Fistulifera solaris TaxID=1519565 RepID=A0A1Z5JJ17_FISSO|nr:ATP-binding cassette, subfamily B (MDR/TAP), member 10 [Fistulifera solaris]|eukprot:GAX13926.1 ATP-binding cassette, subfamily B (MDR/TAP), member 10 [Fistulifera solaris]